MADWRQIQARIRKAKASGNPAENLTELHQRTRDAMVAFELARLHEKNGDNAEAAKWYTTAAQQFRRAQWRVKAEEALARLGAEIPPRAMEADRAAAIEESAAPGEAAPEESERTELAQPSPVRRLDEERGSEEEEETVEFEREQAAEPAPEAGVSPAAEASALSEGRKRHRRGRRGGRKHRRAGAREPEPGKTPSAERTGNEPGPAHAGRPSRAAYAAFSAPHATSSHPSQARSGAGAYQAAPSAEAPPREEAHFKPMMEPTAEPASAATAGRSRGAEPALSSRMAQLESRLRRLLACSLASLKDAEQAPAGPGVLLLSDSDQVTHYYVESCHTLRIGIGNLLRGGRGSKEGGRLKQVMAENLGITESRVSKYMSDHCVVRWLQVDEGAPELAHFAIAVLHPVVNE